MDIERATSAKAEGAIVGRETEGAPRGSAAVGLVRPALRVYRCWFTDSRAWERYVPRDGDIVVATYPKSGTTWMQRIVDLLLLKDPAPKPISGPWIDMGIASLTDASVAQLEGMQHRRQIKTHTPADGVPLYAGDRYIFVARDGRDACLSWHNHVRTMTPGLYDMFDTASEELGHRAPREHAQDPAQFFSDWLDADGKGVAHPRATYACTSFCNLVASWWALRGWENVLLVHYADLCADLSGEMRRIAGFLGIGVGDGALWSGLVDAARFESMKKEGEAIAPGIGAFFRGGADTFFNRSGVGRWRGTYREADLERYRDMVDSELEPACAAWLERGRLGPDAVDPASA
ncbi:sulfotransferase [Hyaloraphidium curvatum]|nr:sulfotransferase [Hyaloraphidium curvatum]